MSLQPNGVFMAIYFGPGQPTPIGIHPEDGFRADRLRSLVLEWDDDDPSPAIVTSAIYEGDHGPVVVNHITYFDGDDDDYLTLTHGLLGHRSYHAKEAADGIAICDGYTLGDFGRAALEYVNEALGGVPDPHRNATA
jgi:hypothetical protein